MLPFDPSFQPGDLIPYAVFNPAVIVVAAVMGWRCDQWQKLVIAAFAAALAGGTLIWLATFVGALAPRPLGSDAGIFVVSLGYALAIAIAGTGLRRLWS